MFCLVSGSEQQDDVSDLVMRLIGENVSGSSTWAVSIIKVANYLDWKLVEVLFCTEILDSRNFDACCLACFLSFLDEFKIKKSYCGVLLLKKNDSYLFQFLYLISSLSIVPCVKYKLFSMWTNILPQSLFLQVFMYLWCAMVTHFTRVVCFKYEFWFL